MIVRVYDSSQRFNYIRGKYDNVLRRKAHLPFARPIAGGHGARVTDNVRHKTRRLYARQQLESLLPSMIFEQADGKHGCASTLVH